MSQVPDPKRWTAADADVPAELGELLRAERDDLGTAQEVAELARRLSAELGPASGLPLREPLAHAGARGVARLAARGLGRFGVWAVAGASAAATLWLVASSLSRAPLSEPPAADRAGADGAAHEAGATPVAPVILPPAPAASEASDAAPPAPIRPAQGQRTAGHGPARGAAPSSRASRALAEAALLERAQAALSRDPAAALALAREHQRSFPRGALTEEREVIAIEALKRFGRHEAADARAAAFERRYRGSVHRPRLERSKDTSSKHGAP